MKSPRTNLWVAGFCSTLLLIAQGCGGEDASNVAAEGNGSRPGSKPYGNENSSAESETEEPNTDTEDSTFEATHRTQSRVMRTYETLEFSDDQELAVRNLINEHGQRLDELIAGQIELRRAPETEENIAQSESIDEQISEELKAIRARIREVLTPDQIKQYRAAAQAKNSESSPVSTD